jgi:2-dehydro-3-deoxyphosphooctonate aldolase (KDO 8-P synthase)
MEPAKFEFSGLELGGDKFLVIAGPCMAESLELCLDVAYEMKAVCAERGLQYVFKASFDKANRSSGSSFRGCGIDKGLGIFAEIKAKVGVPVITDVHECSQVKVCAEVVDALQIPAFLCRQTDLLLAAGETGLFINVKKGQFMAPEDMKGALEKVRSTGNRKVALTERGSTFGYHNLVVDMRGLQIMRELGAPVIFDATHSVQLPGGLGDASGGQRQFIGALARSAAAVGIDGLFAEVHPNPAKALSDGPNSLDFADARKVIDQVRAIHELVRKGA